VRVHGDDGAWVLYLHGFPDDASTFDELAVELAAGGMRVAAVNLRGYAPSPLEGSWTRPVSSPTCSPWSTRCPRTSPWR
jgi:pimeloyl-ACP methyl ester carboxylesterase